ncbi:MAG: LacI family transcriptional regulator [Oscillospiraceae bacterium]|nr:LacI family transcriptional regulator [Oscillospiraceae bacterium]
MVTVYDIAKKTRLSPATVSKALNNYYGVKKETYDLVLSTALEMGYTPNIAARSLTTKKTWLVGVLFSEEVSTGIMHWFYGTILSSAQSRLADAGYDVVFISNNVGGNHLSYIDHCNRRGLEGLIVAASEPHTEAVKCILENDIKMVSVETPYENKYSVISNNKSGTIDALNYLYSLDHERIAYISGPFNTVAGRERNSAYEEFMISKGLYFYKDYIEESRVYDIDEAYNATKRLFERCKINPTAIFVGFGEASIGVMNYLNDNNFKVPDDISVVGFDDTDATVAMGITTIKQDREKIGTVAAEILIDQIEEKEIYHPFDNRIKTAFVERNSCKKLL